MAGISKIEWTDATWNPIVGCSVVSPGCTNCYAMRMAARLQKINRTSSWTGYVNHYDGTTQPSKAGPVWTGKVALAPDHILTQPLRWKKPRRIFVNSMGDLFHEAVPDEWIDRAFAVMALCPQHTFQVLTKRAERMRDFIWRLHQAITKWHHARATGEMPASPELIDLFPHIATSMAHPSVDWQAWPLPNVWLGVSAEDQRRADERIPHLKETPAAIRFISAEPLLGNIAADLSGIDWVIAGGESGPGARPCHPDWARSLRDQCAAAQVPFFWKQWGEWLPGENYMSERPVEPTKWQDGEKGMHSSCKYRPDYRCPEWRHFGTPGEPGAFALRVGKRRAGRLLDGRTHDAFPEPTR